MALYRIPIFALNNLSQVNMRIDRLYRREVQNIMEYYIVMRSAEHDTVFAKVQLNLY